MLRKRNQPTTQQPSNPNDPQQPAPPQVIIIKQQRSRGCMWLVLVLIVVGIAFAVTYNQQKSSGALAFTVTYKVTGTSISPAITYNNATGGTEQKSGATLPWQQSYDFKDGNFFANLVATSSDSGNVTCQVLVGSKVVKEATSSGQFASASCSGFVSVSDSKLPLTTDPLIAAHSYQEPGHIRAWLTAF
jgi:Mycobacterium membrane protein